MNRKVWVTLAALLSIMALSGLSATPAVATPTQVQATAMVIPECSDFGAWTGFTWGKIRWCVDQDYDLAKSLIRVQVDDLATDGYQVHVEAFAQDDNPFWHDVFPMKSAGCGSTTTLASAGPVEDSCWHTINTTYSFGQFVSLRVVKGRGAVPGPHQFIDYGTYRII